MQCPLASSLGTNILLVSLLLVQVLAQFKFSKTKWLTEKLLCNLLTMILAVRDLNEHGGKHRLLQTPSQPMSKRF